MSDTQLLLLNKICPACQQETDNIVEHHWYELPDLKLQTKNICRSCNAILQGYHFYPQRFYNDHKKALHHILPVWEKQVAVLMQILVKRKADSIKKKTINEVNDFPDSIFYRNYKIDPDICSNCDDIYYRILVGFDDLNLAKACLDKWIEDGDIAEDFWL